MRPRSPIGAHVSVAGGLLNAVANARGAACETFQVWVSSARAWKPPALDPAVDHRFRELVAEAGLGPVFDHAAYLVNLASTSQANFDSSVAAVAATLDKAAAIGAAAGPGSPASARACCPCWTGSATSPAAPTWWSS